MGLSWISAMMIFGNDDIRVTSYKDLDGSRYGFVVDLWKHGCFHTNIFSSNPIFDDPETAKIEGDNWVISVRESVKSEMQADSEGGK